MIYSDIKKAFEVLKDNGLNPTLFYTDSSESVSEAYYRVLKEEEGREKEPEGRYEIHCHKKRLKGLHYIEDDFSQAELDNIEGEQVEPLFKKNGNKIYTCFDVFLNRLCILISTGDVDYNDIKVIYCDNDGRQVTKISRDGYLISWPMGYFLHID